MKALLLASLLFVSSIEAQTITTLPIPGGWLCPDDSVDVVFSATGQFESYNVFKVQLSSDTFASFESIGSLQATTSDTIRVYLPRGLDESDHYRVRVVSTAPYVSGTDNGTDLITPDAHNFHIVSTSSELLPYDTVRFTLKKSHQVYSSPELTYLWNFGKDAYPPTSDLNSPPVVHYLSPGKKIVTLDLTFSPACTYRLYGVIFVGNCYPKIPDSAQIVDPDKTYGRRTGHVWVRGGATYLSYDRDTVYAEPGSIVEGSSGLGIWYLKPGAEAKRIGPEVIVYGEGATFDARGATIQCPTLNFDYSEAPSPEDFSSVSKELPQFSIEQFNDRVEIISDAIIRNIQVFDLLGRVIHQQSEGSAIELGNWTAGKYFIRANFGKVVITKAILIE